jgi:hypothetical protein
VAKGQRVVGTEYDEEIFTCGDCHYLARAISRITGWPMVAFMDDGRPNIHAMVKMPDGRMLDIYGPHSTRTARRRWSSWSSGCPIREFTWDAFRSLGWSTPIYGDYVYKRSQIIARRLLAEIGYPC